MLDKFSRESFAIFVDKSIKGERGREEQETIKQPASCIIASRSITNLNSSPCTGRSGAHQQDEARLLPHQYAVDNSYIEYFNGSFRDECLNMNWFMSLEDARDKIERWLRDYSEFRPHSALTYLTPAEFVQKTGLKPPEHRFFLVRSGLLFKRHL